MKRPQYRRWGWVCRLWLCTIICGVCVNKHGDLVFAFLLSPDLCKGLNDVLLVLRGLTHHLQEKNSVIRHRCKDTKRKENIRIGQKCIFTPHHGMFFFSSSVHWPNSAVEPASAACCNLSVWVFTNWHMIRCWMVLHIFDSTCCNMSHKHMVRKTKYMKRWHLVETFSQSHSGVNPR